MFLILRKKNLNKTPNKLSALKDIFNKKQPYGTILLCLQCEQ